MPIEPIDLQVLFSRMLDVGKEQAVQNQLVNVAQSVQASELVRKTQEQSNSVNQTKETDEVRPTGEGEGKAGAGGSETEEQKKRKSKQRDRRASFQDPELGRNIDIIG